MNLRALCGSSSETAGVRQIGSERFRGLPHPKLKFKKFVGMREYNYVDRVRAAGGHFGTEKVRHL